MLSGQACRRTGVFSPKAIAMSERKGELQIPPDALTDPNAVEIARVWGAHGVQHVTLRAGAWKDPGAWGLILVDLARHVANAYAQLVGRDQAEVLARIKESFDVEWNHPTDTPTGSM
jgi:hypothetical protein